MQITVSDINGAGYSITSQNRETIQRWLGETIGRLLPGAAKYNIPLNIRIYPSEIHETTEQIATDWIADSRFITRPYSLDKNGIQQLLDDLRECGIDVPETTGGVG